MNKAVKYILRTLLVLLTIVLWAVLVVFLSIRIIVKDKNGSQAVKEFEKVVFTL